MKVFESTAGDFTDFNTRQHKNTAFIRKSFGNKNTSPQQQRNVNEHLILSHL